MPVELYALMLLIMRIISVSQMASVIRKQRALRKRPINDAHAAQLREEMYTLGYMMLAVNVVPILVDVLTLFSITARPATINPISVLYMFSYAIGTLILTSIIYRIYRNALV